MKVYHEAMLKVQRIYTDYAKALRDRVNQRLQNQTQIEVLHGQYNLAFNEKEKARLAYENCAMPILDALVRDTLQKCPETAPLRPGQIQEVLVRETAKERTQAGTPVSSHRIKGPMDMPKKMGDWRLKITTYAILADPRYAQFTLVVTPFLALTGMVGVTMDNIEATFGPPSRFPNGGFIVAAACTGPTYQLPHIKSIRLCIDDVPTEKIDHLLEPVTLQMDRARDEGKWTIVHCECGKSRSASFVIAYLIRYHKYNLEGAYQYLKKLRPIIKPNIGFMAQLLAFEKVYHPGSTPTPHRNFQTRNGLLDLPTFMKKEYPNMRNS